MLSIPHWFIYIKLTRIDSDCVMQCMNVRVISRFSKMEFGLIMDETVFWVFNQVKLKPVGLTTETSWNFENLVMTSLAIVHFIKPIKRHRPDCVGAQAGLHICCWHATMSK